jgi:hypothetical protein
VSSPYERALDLTGLDPALRTYFSEIPTGSTGRGTGTFDVVGTRRRWLWPFIRILQKDAILAPVWRHDVPFTVQNRPQADGSLIAERRFEFTDGVFTMLDRMTAVDGVLTDVLGTSGRLSAKFHGQVKAGALTLRSRSVAVRIGKHWMRLPAVIAPTVSLTESRSDDGAHQHVSVSLAMPLVGRIYEYAGTFTYAIEHEGN